jgi:hypothetical protein
MYSGLKIIAKVGEQNTFWVGSELENGNITHCHVFRKERDIHSHKGTGNK